MSRHIDADAAKKDVDERGMGHFFILTDIDEIKRFLDDQPTADVEKVRHGKWTLIHVDSNAGYGQVYYQHKDCSTRLFESPDNYCPVCGARMDGGTK